MAIISIKDVSKTYQNGVEALRSVSFEVEKGEFFALLGPNGAGKSTLISILTSLVRKTAGAIQIAGIDIDENFEAAKEYIGVVPQEFNFNVFETVFNNIVNQAGYYGISRKLAKERAEFYLKQLELWDKRHTVSRQLSGGMKRRMMVARALIHEPKVLILDEPTAGVDIEIRRSMWRFLRELNKQGTTIILTTHYLEEAENLCRYIAIIDNGQIIENMPMTQFLGKLEMESFILYLKDPIKTAPSIPGCTITLIDPLTLEVCLPHEKEVSELFDQLKEHHISISRLRNKTNRLEELFIQLTQHGGKDDER